MSNHENPDNLLPASKMAKLHGVAPSTFMMWYYRGIVPGEPGPTKYPRFDPNKVAEALGQHASHHRQSLSGSSGLRMA